MTAAAEAAGREVAARRRRLRVRFLALCAFFPVLIAVASAVGAVPLGLRDLWGELRQ